MSDQMNQMDRTDRTAGPRRRGLTLGLAGGLLAGTAAGLVIGVPGLTGAAAGDVPTALVQQADETEPSDTTGNAPERGSRLRETLQELVDAGAITAEQADAVTSHLVERRPDRGERNPGGHRRGPDMSGRGVAAEALTDVLGLDAEALRAQLREGATLAEIAGDQGVDVQAVIDALVDAVEARVGAAVENGRLDRAEADQKLGEAEARITDMVNNGRPDRGQD
jgi:polyhydroxyalkanoate synthesis regulator phasin